MSLPCLHQKLFVAGKLKGMYRCVSPYFDMDEQEEMFSTRTKTRLCLAVDKVGGGVDCDYYHPVGGINSVFNHIEPNVRAVNVLDEFV